MKHTIRKSLLHYGSKEKLLAEYFEIDLETVENERRGILDEFRKAAK